MNQIISGREHLKTRFVTDGRESDQAMDMAAPPLSKAAQEETLKIDLTPIDGTIIEKLTQAGGTIKNEIYHLIHDRQSHRVFKQKTLSQLELSFLLWATQGIKDVKGVSTLRTVPSGGARHALETYLIIQNVEGLEPGAYHYLPLTHQLERLFTVETGIKDRLFDVTYGQKWALGSAVTFVWTAIPYRSEWRYMERAHKLILLDVGHVCQNLYLACEVIGCGTCAINAYDQDKTDAFLNLDGIDEFAVYLSPVGKV